MSRYDLVDGTQSKNPSVASEKTTINPRKMAIRATEKARMTDKTPDDYDVFLQMASEFPVRTSIFTFGLPVFALLQFLNGLVHDGSLVYIGMFTALVVVFSVKLTQYQITVFRRKNVANW